MEKDNLLRVGIAAGAVAMVAGIGVGAKIVKKKKAAKRDLMSLYENWLERVEDGRAAVLDMREKFGMSEVPDIVNDITNMFHTKDVEVDLSYILKFKDGGSLALNAHVTDDAEDGIYLPDKMTGIRRHDFDLFGTSHTEMNYDTNDGNVGFYIKSSIIRPEFGDYIVIHMLSENATRLVDYLEQFLEQSLFVFNATELANEYINVQDKITAVADSFGENFEVLSEEALYNAKLSPASVEFLKDFRSGTTCASEDEED